MCLVVSLAQRRLYAPFEAVSLAPLVVFRILFGTAMTLGVIRFMALGWIHEQYVAPKVHFSYFGFAFVPVAHDWLQLVSGGWSIYGVFCLMLLAALGVMVGAWYRVAIVTYFLTFTYVELIDKTYYLNHYYFVSLVALLLCFVPASGDCSFDVYRKPALRLASVPRWMIDIFKFQVGIVYVYAGLAKMTHEWLFNAMPLRLWLPANDTLPIIGFLMRESYMPWVFSWAGMLYDSTIVLWLMYAKTRFIAYVAVIFFHLLTGLMFQIGMFPLVMIAVTPIFFSTPFHERCLQRLRAVLRTVFGSAFRFPDIPPMAHYHTFAPRFIASVLTVHLAFQLLFPWRFALYDGNMLWTEEGYRFGWRVMLMEKAATATFYVRQSFTGREGEVVNREFLNAHQEKQMAMQPDMILQFAHFLRDKYSLSGSEPPYVRAEVYATLNARPSRLLIDSSVNLASQQETFAQKSWVLPWKDVQLPIFPRLEKQ